MSYSLEQLPDGMYRLETDDSSICFSRGVFREIQTIIDRHERQEINALRAEEDRKKEAMLKAAGVGAGLPYNSIFRQSVAEGRVDSTVIWTISQGFIHPNGSMLWSAYFSKIDWENDGHLFEPFLQKSYGENALAHFKEYHRDTMTRDVFHYLSGQRIEYVNKFSTGETHLVNVGLTDSRDYTPFNFACAKVYGVDPREDVARCDVNYAKENFETMIDAIYDASVFICESPCNRRSSCPGIEYDHKKSTIKESALCAAYLSRFFTDRQWAEICKSNIWLLVKDIVAVRKSPRPVAA